MDWLGSIKIPIGYGMKLFVDFLNTYFAWLFNGISFVLGGAIDGVVDLLQLLPSWVLIALVALLAWWLHRSWQLVVLVVVGLLLIVNLGYWKETTETLALVVAATVISMAIGVPVGILCAHRPWLYRALRPVLDMMQTIPTFVYLIPTLILFGLGVVPGLISTIIFAIPAPIRMTQFGIASVPKQLHEAGAAFGATPSQLLWKVELPYALPTIMEGLTQTIMLSLSMVVIAALVGADGLGKPVVRALNTVNIERGLEAGLAIVIVAIVLDRLCRRPADTRGR